MAVLALLVIIGGLKDGRKAVLAARTQRSYEGGRPMQGSTLVRDPSKDRIQSSSQPCSVLRLIAKGAGFYTHLADTLLLWPGSRRLR